MTTERIIVRRFGDIEPFIQDAPVFSGDITSHPLLAGLGSGWSRVSHVSFVDGATLA